MSPTADLILDASKKYTLIVYLILFISGIIGNASNLIIFGCFKVFRGNKCAFYIIAASVADLFLTIIVLPFRTSQYVWNYDPTALSLVWCKMRYMVVGALSLMSFASICFVAIDQYLSTNCRPWVRQLSTLKLAHRLVGSAVIILTIHGIPFLVYYEIRPTGGCNVYDVGFSRYYSFVHFCVLSGILPITLSGFFAGCAYVNVRRIVRQRVNLVRRRLDQQLTAMILSKVVFLMLTTSPFVTFRIYQMNRPAIDPNNLVTIAVEQLAFTVTSSLFYLNSAGTFYVFLIVSKRFRIQIKREILKHIWYRLVNMVRKSNTINNQVTPMSHGIDLESEQ